MFLKSSSPVLRLNSEQMENYTKWLAGRIQSTPVDQAKLEDVL